MSGYLAVESALNSAPGDWKRLTFKRLTVLVKEPNVQADEPLLSLASSGVVSARVEMDGLGRQAPNESTIRDYWKLRPEQVVVNPMWLVGGSIGVSAVAGAVSPAYRVYRIRPGVLPRFLHYSLRAYPYMEQYRLLGRGDTTFDRSVGREDFEGLPVLLPPLAEQRRIADFLDDQVARLDRAIELRQRQVHLVQERLYTLYEQTLYHGNEMAVTPLGYISRVVDTEHKTAPHVPGGGYWVAGTSSIRDGRILHRDLYETDRASHLEWTARATPTANDVLLTREAPVGEVARVTGDDPLLCIGQRVVLLRPTTGLVPHFLLFSLMSPSTRRFYADVTQGSLHPHLNMRDIGRIPIPLRPRAEQLRIVDHLNGATASARTHAGLMDRSIGLIAERKQALITAAVTGQFDVTTARSVA